MYSLADAEYFYNKKTKDVILRKDYEKLMKESTKGITSYDGIIAVEKKLGYDFCYKHSNGEFRTTVGKIIEGLEESKGKNLTPTEQRISGLAKEGFTNRQIAERLGIAEGTIRTHMSKILIKLNIKSRKELKEL